MAKPERVRGSISGNLKRVVSFSPRPFIVVQQISRFTVRSFPLALCLTCPATLRDFGLNFATSAFHRRFTIFSVMTDDICVRDFVHLPHFLFQNDYKEALYTTPIVPANTPKAFPLNPV
jgi:hypothetical protein